MPNKILRLAAFLMLAAFASGVEAQTYPPPDLSPFVRSVQQVLPDATGNVAGIATVPQLNQVMIAADTIHVVTPTTGQTVIPNTGATILFINNAGLIAALSVTMPSNPADGQRFLIAARSGVTILTVTGGTIYGAAGGLSLAGYARFVYSATAGAWFRTG